VVGVKLGEKSAVGVQQVPVTGPRG
jgi:hypothetical protein